MITSPTSRQNDPFIGKIFLNKYTMRKKLGEGSFGKIYKASSSEGDFAIKLEKKSKGNNLLELEGYIMNYLKGPGIPTFKLYTPSTDYNILVMQLLGKSLEDLLMKYNTFSVRTVCNLAIQMLDVIKRVHDKHIIHRDIKPDNFTTGLGHLNNHLYLIDFGLAKKYRSSKTLEQYPMRTGKKLTGTARYASVNALGGVEQSRRDDLESIAYVLVYLAKGSLPWQGLPIKKKEDRYKKIHDKKKSILPEQLCVGLPSQFQDFVVYTKSLEYEEEPKYDYLKELMYTVLVSLDASFDYFCDWIKEDKTKENIQTDATDNNDKDNDKKKNIIEQNQNYLNEQYNNNLNQNVEISYSPKNEIHDSCNINIVEENTDMLKSGVDDPHLQPDINNEQPKSTTQQQILQEQEEKGITVVNQYYQQINNIVIHHNTNNNNTNENSKVNSPDLNHKHSHPPYEASGINNNNSKEENKQQPLPNNNTKNHLGGPANHVNIVLTNNLVEDTKPHIQIKKSNEAEFNESFHFSSTKPNQNTLHKMQGSPSHLHIENEDMEQLKNNKVNDIDNIKNSVSIHKDINQDAMINSKGRNSNNENTHVKSTVNPLYQKKIGKEHKGSKCCTM